MEKKDPIRQKIKEFFQDKFDLSADKAHEDEVVENIKKSAEFKGTNLWILIFATFIASIGLNTNSSAVIIGAMLISPLMGPIIGIGMAVAINDFELLKRALRNFMFAISISLIVSALYFIMSPLTIAQSELLSRTQPTTWDVLIGLFGGLAGIVAQSRKDRTSTVIPGVAIATALMPPLCTAGFGLATLNMEYFFGALYLFVINSIFIALATYSLVRFMKYKKKTFVNPIRERQIKRIMGAIVFVIVVPSILLAINIVRETTFKANTKHYVENVFEFNDTQVINYTCSYSASRQEIEVTLIGKPISDDAMQSIHNQLVTYSLDGAELSIKQQSMGDTTLASTTIRSLDKLQTFSQEIIKEKEAQIEHLTEQVNKFKLSHVPVEDIVKEFGAISGMKDVQLAVSKLPVYNLDGSVADTVLTCFVTLQNKSLTLTDANKTLIVNWLKVRTSSKNVRIIVE
ncbi:MAG: TIGR00341 family protein [Rikenellaceae bacterium]